MYLTPDHLVVNVDVDQHILINLVNGNADLIDSQLLECLRSGRFEDIDSRDIELLCSRSYLFESKDSGDQFVNEVEKAILAQADAEPPNFVYIPNYTCNLNCYYCFQNAYKKNSNKLFERPIDAAQAFFHSADRIIEAHRDKYPTDDPSEISLTITGGEPLLPINCDVLAVLLEGCRVRKIVPSIVTNGYELSRFMPLLMKYGVKDIQVTVDGSKSVHDKIRLTKKGNGTFDSIAQAIRELAGYSNQARVRINATKANIASLTDDSFADLVSSNPEVQFYVYFMQQEGCAATSNIIDEVDGITYLLNLVDSNKKLANLDFAFHGEAIVHAVFDGRSFHPKIKMCSAMRNQYIFDYTGGIYKCWWGMGNASYLVGSFSTRSFSISKELESIYRNRTINNISKCKSCKFRLVCGGGYTGRVSRSDFKDGSTQCPRFEEVLTTVIRHRFRKCVDKC